MFKKKTFFITFPNPSEVTMASHIQSSIGVQNDVFFAVEEFYLSKKMADIRFIFKLSDGQIEHIPAHKILLASTSDVFRAMFNGSWREKNEVEITDASVDAFKEFLQFVYLPQVKVSTNHIAEVMYLGDKYNVTNCLKTCTQLLMDSLNEDNVCSAYKLAILFNEEYLKKYCELIIKMNTKTVLESENFLECDSKVLNHILKLDSLSSSETEVFEACMNWARAKANVNQLTREILETQLGENFHEIHFKSITQKEFANLVSTYGDLFSISEYKDISQMMAFQEFEPKVFSKKLRVKFDILLHCEEKDLIRCERALSNFTSTMPYYIQEVEKTTFSINQPLFLRAFECTVLRVNDSDAVTISEVPSKISIFQIADSAQSPDRSVLHNQNITLKVRERTYVTLSAPILVKPGFKYEIKFKQSPASEFTIGALLKSKVQMQSNITVHFHGDPVLKGDMVPRGLILNIKFSSL